MKKKSLLHQFALGLLIGILLMPPRAQAQWTVYDPAQYTLQVTKKVEEANRWIQHYTNLVQQLTTLKGVLDTAEDLVSKQKNAITTMSNIGRTVRGAYQLKNQVGAIVTTRLNAIKRIDDRLRNGIFDPEQDMRDFDDYLRESIGRTSQDIIANRERLARMDNQLEKWQRELSKAREERAKAEAKSYAAKELRDEELAKPESERCAACIANLNQEMATYDILVTQLKAEIANLETQIENRVKQYNLQMQERVRFGEQVQSLNDGWSRFNNSLDELQKTLSKVH
jgi:predicted  nucleic acid-binding Zn-ribbon protein